MGDQIGHLTNDRVSDGRRRLWLCVVVFGALVAALPVAAESEDLAAQVSELNGRIDEQRSQLRTVEQELAAATGEERELVEERLWKLTLEQEKAFEELAAALEKQRVQGDDVTSQIASLSARVENGWTHTRQQLLQREARVKALRDERENAPAEDLRGIDRKLRGEIDRLVENYSLLTDIVLLLESLDVDVAEPRQFLSEKFEGFADSVAARVNVQQRRRDDLAKRIAASPDDAELKSDLRTQEERLEQSTASLAALVDMLKRLDLEASEYRQVLIAATGEITTDILDKDVALGLLARVRDNVLEDLTANGPGWLFKVVLFFAILGGFRVFAAITRKFVARSVQSSKLRFSQLLQETLVSWSARAVMLVGLLVALSQMGFEIGALLAGLGIAGFVLGFALQDSLSNFAAGAMILMYRPFDVGDLIEASGVSGHVSRMTLVSTTILTIDYQTLIVPNNKIWGDVIRNFTAQQKRRVDLVVGVGYGEDVDRVDAVLRDIVAKQENILDDPPLTVEVHNLGDSSVDFIVRPWVKTENYWKVYWAMTREVKRRFDKEGIQIPFPQRDVHHYYPEPPPAAEHSGQAAGPHGPGGEARPSGEEAPEQDDP